MRLLARLLFARRRPTPRPHPSPTDPERLQRIYRETHRQVEDLRRAA
ncbi:MAG TPA: hypothetical protein VGP54_08195 [Gaiellaceae bacterium]|jgi:hypothetical protein|nr:hypothetical protein [Gaiellaceae bacterium]